MTDRSDERAKVDRTKDPDDPNKDVREEYTAYREREPDRAKHDREAAREADLQPSAPDHGQRDDGAGEGSEGSVETERDEGHGGG